MTKNGEYQNFQNRYKNVENYWTQMAKIWKSRYTMHKISIPNIPVFYNLFEGQTCHEAVNSKNSPKILNVIFGFIYVTVLLHVLIHMFLNCVLCWIVILGGDYKRLGYVQCVPVISADVPFTYYVQRFRSVHLHLHLWRWRWRWRYHLMRSSSCSS